MSKVKPTFEESYAEIANIVASRRKDWTYLSIMPWEDVSQILLVRIFNKGELYEPSKAPKLEHWVNRVITHALLNLRRDCLLRYSRPCIGGGKANGQMCSYNQGGESCGYTKSGTQCDECPVYAEWAKKRQHLLHLKSNVALENHAQEVSNMQGDFCDAGRIKEQLDAAILKELTRWEGRIYRAPFQRHMTPSEVVDWLQEEAAKRKRPLGPNEPSSYGTILIYRREFEGMMREWLYREGHISEEKARCLTKY